MGMMALILIVLLIQLRLLINRELNQPVFDTQQRFLAHVATRSSDAGTLLAMYRVKHQRDTVAMQHFHALCALMVDAARRQGFDPDGYATEMTAECVSKGKDALDIP
jgi:hypothetical protein